MKTRLMDETGDDPVAVEGRAKIIGRDKQILSPLQIGKDMAGPAGMDLKLSGEEIRGFGQDVVIPADPDDATPPFQGGQCPVKQGKILTTHPERARDAGGLKRLSLKQGQEVGYQSLVQSFMRACCVLLICLCRLTFPGRRGRLPMAALAAGASFTSPATGVFGACS